MEKKKILIIEDEMDILENVKILLESENYEVFTATNADEGIKKIKLSLPDLIICDIVMQGKDGYEVLKEIHENETTNLVPFIFLTAKVERKDLRKGMELGADDYLFKPFSAVELLNAIETRLNKFQIIADVISSHNKQDQLDYNDSIFVSFHNSIIPIRLQKIKYILAENQYSKIVIESQKKFTFRKSLSDWEKLLPDGQFLRIHRSTIINIEYISKIEKTTEGALVVFVENMEEQFEVSRSHIKNLNKIKI